MTIFATKTAKFSRILHLTPFGLKAGKETSSWRRPTFWEAAFKNVIYLPFQVVLQNFALPGWLTHTLIYTHLKCWQKNKDTQKLHCELRTAVFGLGKQTRVQFDCSKAHARVRYVITWRLSFRILDTSTPPLRHTRIKFSYTHTHSLSEERVW